MDVNYRGTLIAVADDCPVTEASVPVPRGGKPTVPLLQYEMLKDHPYEFTSADVIFESAMRHKGVSAKELKAKRQELWDAFFSKPQPCLRTSALPKKYGWGIHCNSAGKVALCPMESAEYRRHAKGTLVKAMRSSRA